jgi:hypothetical protein
MPDKDIDNIPITVEVPKADVWLRADYRDIVHRLGEVHMVRACEHQHDDDFVPMYDFQTIEGYQIKAEQLRRDAERAWAEVDKLVKQIGDLATLRMQDELVHGNIMGRIAANLFGRQNNVTDEDCVSATAELGYRIDGLHRRVAQVQEERNAWMERYQRMLEWAAQLKAYEPPAPILVDADSPVLATLAHRPCTCHPEDNPPQPCPHKYALQECRDAAIDAARKESK